MRRFRREAAAPVALALGLALAAVAPLVLGGCSVNPATGDEQFTAFLSPEEERRVGAQEHPKLVKAFGGLYDDPALQRYVSSLGRLLQQTSEQPEPPLHLRHPGQPRSQCLRSARRLRPRHARPDGARQRRGGACGRDRPRDRPRDGPPQCRAVQPRPRRGPGCGNSRRSRRQPERLGFREPRGRRLRARLFALPGA